MTAIRVRATLVLVLTIAGLAAGGCGDDGSPVPSGVTFTAALSDDGAAVDVSYTVHNGSDDPLLVFNALPREGAVDSDPEVDPDAVYVYPEDDVVVLAKRLFTEPDGFEADSPSYLRGTVVAAGDELTERERVRFPLQPWHPFADDELPDPVRTVVFCVGVAPARDVPPRPGSERQT